jgi:biotin transport system substrate-specific component
VLTGLSIALIAAGAFITVPLGPLPFTLQTMMLGIVVCLLPQTYSVAAVGGYLALGCLGLPVFSGMRGGIAVLAGPTGGFLVGFLLAALIVAFFRSGILRPQSNAEKAHSRPRWFFPLIDGVSLLLFSIIYYIPGFLWFMVSAGVTPDAALTAAVLPFLLPDVLKAVAAFICIQPVRVALNLNYEQMAARRDF